ncbi:hypothetical protein ACQVRV_21970 (plasmid) [Ralstonia pseudosolanacearum]
MKNILILITALILNFSVQAAGYGEYADNNANLCREIIKTEKSVNYGTVFCKPTKNGGEVTVYGIVDKSVAAGLAARIAELAYNKFSIPSIDVDVFIQSKDEVLKGSFFTKPRPVIRVKMEE